MLYFSCLGLVSLVGLPGFYLIRYRLHVSLNRARANRDVDHSGVSWTVCSALEESRSPSWGVDWLDNCLLGSLKLWREVSRGLRARHRARVTLRRILEDWLGSPLLLRWRRDWSRCDVDILGYLFPEYWDLSPRLHCLTSWWFECAGNKWDAFLRDLISLLDILRTFLHQLNLTVSEILAENLLGLRHYHLSRSSFHRRAQRLDFLRFYILSALSSNLSLVLLMFLLRFRFKARDGYVEGLQCEPLLALVLEQLLLRYLLIRSN